MNKMKKIIVIIALVLLFSSGCDSNSMELDNIEITVTDVLGREVNLKNEIKKVVAVGPGALRLYTIVGDLDKLVGIEQIEIDSNTGRPYNIANPELQNIEVIGMGGPNNQPDTEKILSVKPDVIFSMYSTDLSAVEKLQKTTNIPVVALSYGTSPPYDENIYSSLLLIGEVMDKESRGEEVVRFLKDVRSDLDARTRDLEYKPKVYIGALSSKGIHGIESTAGNYALLNAINATNVADELGKSGSIMIDKEKLIEWNPDKIIIDMAGKDLVIEEYNLNKSFYDEINAFKNNEIYMQLPFNYYNTNIGTSIANAYYIGKSIYPEEFEDIMPEVKADEIYEFLYGEKVYNKMTEDYGKYEKLKIN